MIALEKPSEVTGGRSEKERRSEEAEGGSVSRSVFRFSPCRELTRDIGKQMSDGGQIERCKEGREGVEA